MNIENRELVPAQVLPAKNRSGGRRGSTEQPLEDIERSPEKDIGTINVFRKILQEQVEGLVRCVMGFGLTAYRTDEASDQLVPEVCSRKLDQRV